MKKFLLFFAILLVQTSLGRADQYALHPEAYLYKSFADQLLIDGRREEALFAYQWANLLDPSYGNAYYNRAIALNDMGKFAEARDALESYLKLCPKDAEALYNKGILSLYLQDFETAESALSMSLCFCKDPQFARSISKALTFLVRYQDGLKSSDQKGQKKLYQQLLAFTR